MSTDYLFPIMQNHHTENESNKMILQDISDELRNKDERLTLYKARCEMSKCRKEPYFKEYKINMISLVSQIFVPIKQF